MVLSLEQISQQLDSDSVKDRKLALAALRDVAPEDAVPLIKKVLKDDNQQVRSMAVFSLGIKQTPECLDILVNMMQTEDDYGVRADAAGALGYLEDVRALEPLVRAFYEDDQWLVRFSAAVALGNLKDPRAKDTLLAALKSKEVVLQQAAIAASEKSEPWTQSTRFSPSSNPKTGSCASDWPNPWEICLQIGVDRPCDISPKMATPT
jgi:HEAT repeat protein